MSAQYHPRLSVDIILTILPLLDQSTALAVSAANKELRKHVSFIVLQKPVVLRSYPGMVSFNAFIREEDSFTCHCDQVHDLDITLPHPFPPSQIPRLKKTLAALTGLRWLTVRNLEVNLNAAPSFRRVFEDIRSLDVLTIVDVGVQTIKFLPGSRPQFRSLRILEPIWRFPVAEALVGRKCEELVAYNCQVPPMSYPSDASVVTIPELRRLHIPRFCLQRDHCGGFMSIAPGLRVLDVGTDYSSWTWSDELFRHRHNNKDATVRFQLQVAANHRKPAWTRLKLVRGGLVDLLMFGNTCRADVLELVGEPAATPVLHRLIPKVVLDHAPRVLRLSLSGPQFDMGVFLAERPALGSVESLYARIVLTSVSTETEWAACEYALAELTYSFAGCRVLCVELEAVGDAVRDFLAGKDREQIAGAITARTERVQVVCVSTSLGPAYWRVGGARGGVRELEEPQLANEEGRRLLADWGVFSEAYPLCDPSSD